MDFTLEELGSWDLFFYYGQNNLDLEIESELMLLLLQYPRSLYYNNQEHGGIAGAENYPNGFNFQIKTRFDIASAVAWKNSQVNDGADGGSDRRIAVSQSSVSFESDNMGNLDVSVLYIPFYNYSKYKVTNYSMAGVK